MIDLKGAISQKSFGELVGISQPAVSGLVKRGTLVAGESCGQWLQAYCANLREQAAARAASGDLDLASERASLARAQRERIEMQNATTRRELAPVALIEMVLADVGQQVAAILESIPGKIKRRSDTFTSEHMEIMVAEITKARNVAAAVQLDMEKYGNFAGDSESDSERIEGA